METKHTPGPWKQQPDNSFPIAINGIVFGGGEGSSEQYCRISGSALSKARAAITQANGQ